MKRRCYVFREAWINLGIYALFAFSIYPAGIEWGGFSGGGNLWSFLFALCLFGLFGSSALWARLIERADDRNKAFAKRGWDYRVAVYRENESVLIKAIAPKGDVLKSRTFDPDEPEAAIECHAEWMAESTERNAEIERKQRAAERLAKMLG